MPVRVCPHVHLFCSANFSYGIVEAVHLGTRWIGDALKLPGPVNDFHALGVRVVVHTELARNRPGKLPANITKEKNDTEQFEHIVYD